MLVVENGYWNRVSYLKFDLTNVTTAPTSAKFNLTVDPLTYGNSTINLKVYSVSNTWTETGLTYNNQPNFNPASKTSTGTFLTSQPVTWVANGTISLDLTSFIAANLGKVVTFQLINESQDFVGLVLKSREATSGQPLLKIAY